MANTLNNIAIHVLQSVRVLQDTVSKGGFSFFLKEGWKNI
jgi:hypothetical protein